MRDVLTKILLLAGIVSILAIFILMGTLKLSDESNKKLDTHFSENILP